MKVVAALQVDFRETTLGTASRLSQDLAGSTIMTRTLSRITRAKRIDSVHIICPTQQLDECKRFVPGADDQTSAAVQVHPVDPSPIPWAKLVQTARKWSLDSWRGGLGGALHFDEFVDCKVLTGLLEVVSADAVLVIPAAAPVIDPALADAMIAHREKIGAEARLVFCQAPPGLAGILLDASLVSEIGAANSPLGWAFSYKPDAPQRDLIFQPCNYEVSQAVRHSGGRLVADTDRSVARLERLLAAYPDPSADDAGRWLMEIDGVRVESLPREVEIAITHEDPYPKTLHHPRGKRVSSHEPVSPPLVGRIADELSEVDDALILLSGFGDPLRHPDLGSVLTSLRRPSNGQHGVYGVALRTFGVNLDEQCIDMLISQRVDVLQIVLDAWTPETYGRIHAPDDPAAANLDTVLHNIELLERAREQRGSVHPIIVPEFTKSRLNVHELDDFHDGWLRRVGSVSITGFSHRGRQLDDLSVIRMTPPSRTPCHRLRSRCVVLADGSVVACDQDLVGHQVLGHLRDNSLAEIWQGDAALKLRAAHNERQFESLAPCASCDEWHRP